MLTSAGPGHGGGERAGPGAYSTEIDQQIEANAQESAEAHAAYLAGQAVVRR